MRTASGYLGLVFVLVGCGFSSAPINRTSGYEGGSSAGGSGATGESSAVAGPGTQSNPGTLTAGIWDDSLNFPLFTAFRAQQDAPLVDFSPAEQEAASLAAESRTATTSLDLVLVVDTTGSMGDEIRWLQTEFQALAADVQQAHPNVPQRWALVHYRDDGDEYVVRSVDFTTDVSAFQASLSPLAAGGGGDFPEAPDQALERAASLSWDPAATTAKLIFWVADAPPHDGAAARFSSAVRAVRATGAHVYPVASSGIDLRTEYAMRATAQLTLGRYVFLTDDSGVGGTHLEPSVPCFVVTKLNHALQRAIDSELAGTRVEVDPARVIRTVGNPVGGQCALDGGATASIF